MQITVNKSLFFLLFFIVITALLYLLAPVLTPFLIAALIAYLFDPLVEKMTRWHVPRLLSVIIVFLGLLSLAVVLILLLIPLIQKQIQMLIFIIPSAFAWLQEKILPWLQQTFGLQEGINIETIKHTLSQHWSQAENVLTWVVKKAFQSGVTIAIWVTNLLLIPVVTFYLLRDWKSIVANVRSLLPRHVEPSAVKLANECNSVLSAFFRGQFLVMISLGIIYSVGLSLIGLQVGIIIGLIAGLLTIVPYLGFIVGILAASIAAYLQFGTITSVLLVFAVFMTGQVLDTVFLTPKLVGDRIGLHPVAVILAVLAGGSLFGFFGVLLALPVAAVIMVWLRFLNQRYRRSELYK